MSGTRLDPLQRLRAVLERRAVGALAEALRETGRAEADCRALAEGARDAAARAGRALPAAAQAGTAGGLAVAALHRARWRLETAARRAALEAAQAALARSEREAWGCRAGVAAARAEVRAVEAAAARELAEGRRARQRREEAAQDDRGPGAEGQDR